MSSGGDSKNGRSSQFSKNAIDRLSNLKKVHPIAGLDHRHFHPKGHDPFQHLSRKERRKIEKNANKIGKKYGKLIASLSAGGSQYANSNFIRSLAIEYNNRYASAGIRSQPVSFNYLEPFIRVDLIENCAPCVRLRPEVNQLFYIPDFVDYITSDLSSGFEFFSLMGLPEGKIFHFTPNGMLSDFTYLVSDQREFLISGFSFVRHGDSLHWMMLGGEIYDEVEWAEMTSNIEEASVAELDPYKSKFLQEMMERNGTQNGKPLHIEGHEFAHHTILLAEMDLDDGSFSTRCVMRDFENSYQIQTDDIGIFGPNVSDERVAKLLENAEVEFTRSRVMWSLGISFLQLPEYFALRLAVKKEDFVRSEGSIRGISSKLGQGISGKFSAIKSLELVDADTKSEMSIAIRKVVPPYFRDGVSENGGIIVDSKTGGVECPIYVKETLSSAAEKIEEIYTKISSEPQRATSERGVLYIMRCMGMHEQIYKVGYTERSAIDRAKELSSSSSAPNAFTVVKTWAVENPRQFETNIHALLDPYRWNKKREFFKISAERLISIIEDELVRIS